MNEKTFLWLNEEDKIEFVSFDELPEDELRREAWWTDQQIRIDIERIYKFMIGESE